MDIVLREAAPSESDFVFNVRREAYGPYVELEGGWDQARERERHADRWKRPLRFRVLRVNPRALAFYLASGCRVVGESDSHISLQWTNEAG